MIDELARRAKTALGNRDLAWFVSEIGGLNAGPRALSAAFRAAAAAEPSLGDHSIFRDAVAAVDAWKAGVELADKAARLYHDERIRAEFSEDELRWAWENPQAAFRHLIDAGAKGGIEDGELTHEILTTIAETRTFAEEHGLPVAGETAPSPSIPADRKSQDSEFQTLIQKRPDELSEVEHARLLVLAQHRADREAAELDRAATAPSPAPGEFDRLVRKSLDGPLDPAEQGRLRALAEQRGIAEGRLDPADVQFDRQLDGPAADDGGAGGGAEAPNQE